MNKKQAHRLTWEMWCPVTVEAPNREAAILLALERQPKHIPEGTKLFYGLVGGAPVGLAKRLS